MEPWWTRYPSTLEAEKAALNAWGKPWSIQLDQFELGRLVVTITVEFCGGERELVGFYPDSYPYFMPHVRLRGMKLPRHHNPGGYLCLLAQDGDEWHPGQDTLASLLEQQLPILEEVTQIGAASEYVAANEEHVGEPLSNFLPYMGHSAIIVPDELPPIGISSGTLLLDARVRGEKHPGIIAILRRISDNAGVPLVDYPVQMFAFKQRSSGLWTRLEGRPELGEGIDDEIRKRLYDLALETSPALQKRLHHAKAGEEIIFGFLYADQVEWRQAAEDWLFLWLRVAKAARHGRNPTASIVDYGLVRADWAGEDSLLKRAPALAPLRSKSVLLVGTGAIGSTLAMQLAKSGIRELRLVDTDHLQAGNSVRWAFGWEFAGFPKAEVIAHRVASDYPRTKATASTFRIGGFQQINPSDGLPFSDYDFLREEMRQVDLIIDATANYRVNHLLADVSRVEGKAYVWLSTTPGASGGVVGRVTPTATQGCWHCFQHAMAAGEIRYPADNGALDVQPRGCTHPTFVAAGIDSDEVSILASRLAVATLLAQDGGVGQASDFEWDVAVGDFFSADRRIESRWTTYPLHKHPDCSACA